MEQLALAIKEFLMIKGFWNSESDIYIYYDGKCLSREGIEENVNPDFRSNPETLSMSFEGEFYEVLEYGDNLDLTSWKIQDELMELFERHGYWFEYGNSWNLTCYPA